MEKKQKKNKRFTLSKSTVIKLTSVQQNAIWGFGQNNLMCQPSLINDGDGNCTGIPTVTGDLTINNV